MPLRIGYKASAEQFGPRDLVEYTVRAEEVGLDSVWVSDHFSPWRHTGGHAPFSFAWMAAVGERTSRVQIGTSVLTATFRYNPAVVAQAFATLACLYPDRMILGLGTGEALNETAVTGADWPEFKERFARMREAVRLMRQLWTEDGVNFDGEYYTTVDATVYDKPDAPVPVYIAAGGPVVAKYAGRSGDGFICTSGKGMELYTDKLLPAVAEGAEAAGRDAAAGEESLTSFSLRDVMRGDARANPDVRPGDIVTIPDADQVYVVGNVLKPSTLTLRETLTVSQAVAMAGGLLPDSRTERVRVVRQTADGKTEIFVDLKAVEKRRAEDVALQANDIVDVPTAGGKRFLRGILSAVAPAVGQLPVRIIP